MITIPGGCRVGFASHAGVHERNADAVAVHHYRPAVATAVALVDAIGTDANAVTLAGVAAEVATRVGTRKGALAGLLAASELCVDPTREYPREDAAAVVAVARPSGTVVIAWCGNCRAYALDDSGRLRPVTIDHTQAERLRAADLADHITPRHTATLTCSLGLATVGTVGVTEADAPVILLASDGLFTALPEQELHSIVSVHRADPQGCVDELITAALARHAFDNLSAAILIP
ncbi:hypothetical protein NLX83_13780 [Allokutzneria sp. A3M-2-11 16]|uniref:PP2C family protein-serine/threonine phosphatase n=1 Tax=Allokutzneria sp. A3M-2-11 16 TaxID=2962043 RepID=UPI0020B7C8BD|nr:hypothetical protein [Allokutzneria sp. A3M-2-11 16]MCP3800329.1 hypothetical protein [Allokutzneria sp. A3M-2-11 16]